MKTGVVIGAVLIAISITTHCLAQEFRIPYSVKKHMFEKEMKKLGYDFSGSDDSDGRTEDKGTMFVVYTNKSATEYTMNNIMKIAMRCVRHG